MQILRQQIALQQKQIEELRQSLQKQEELLNRIVNRSGQERAVATTGATVTGAPAPALRDTAAAKTAPGEKRDLNLAGFRFSGDFRFRLDAQLRPGNEFAAPLQNVRGRYRVRLNVDKELDRQFLFHLQLSTGPFSSVQTNDQDFGGIVAKHPFSIAEAFIDYHPNRNFSIRGGRMEEVFADGMRFLWDDDVRFNGFQQIARVPLGANVLGMKSVEFRAGEYWLTNPNVAVLSGNSPYVAAGYTPGQKVRDAQLFHPGFIVKGDIGSSWAQQFTGDAQLYRNANQIQLASTAAGYPLVISAPLGIAVSAPVGGTGNATPAPGGAMYAASNFRIVRAGYRLEYKGLSLGSRELPFWVDLQASRNVGASRLRDAYMISANLGSVKRFGDARFLYQYAWKDASALISQLTDDDLGTGSGVNIRTHGIRFDIGLTRFLQWQNLLFIQSALRGNDPARNFFVPLPFGARTTYRYLGQLAFAF